MKKLITLIAIALVAITSVHAENIFSAGYKKLFGNNIDMTTYKYIDYSETDAVLLRVSKSTLSEVNALEECGFIIDGKLKEKQIAKLNEFAGSVNGNYKKISVTTVKEGKKVKTILSSKEMEWSDFSAIKFFIDDTDCHYFKATNDFVMIWDYSKDKAEPLNITYAN